MPSTMPRALALASTAAALGEVPVGCVITDAAGNTLSETHNTVEATQNPLRHAEMLAIEAALAARGGKYLEGCTLTVTLEPCALCAAAIAATRIARVVFGAYDPKSGGVEHGARVLNHSHHTPEIIGGVMESECAGLLSQFFAARR